MVRRRKMNIKIFIVFYIILISSFTDCRGGGGGRGGFGGSFGKSGGRRGVRHGLRSSSSGKFSGSMKYSSSQLLPSHAMSFYWAVKFSDGSHSKVDEILMKPMLDESGNLKKGYERFYKKVYNTKSTASNPKHQFSSTTPETPISDYEYYDNFLSQEEKASSTTGDTTMDFKY